MHSNTQAIRMQSCLQSWQQLSQMRRSVALASQVLLMSLVADLDSMAPCPPGEAPSPPTLHQKPGSAILLLLLVGPAVVSWLGVWKCPDCALPLQVLMTTLYSCHR